MKQFNNRPSFGKPGFTLTELIIYVAILGAVSLVLVGFLGEIYRYYYDVQFKGQVSSNLRFVSQVIEQSIRSAQKINGASSTLSLAMNDSSKNPTVFGLESGRIYKQEGTGGKLYLSAKNVEVTDLDFSYLNAALSEALPPNQWAWSGGASSQDLNEGVGWIDFKPSNSEVRIPLGQGDFLGMAYSPWVNNYLSLNCLSTNSCDTVDYKVYSDSDWILHGWAWSDLFGWLSFNSQDTSSTVSYQVSISSSTGEFSGWAWSENIGWVSFNCANAEVNSCATVDYKVQVNRQQGRSINTVYVQITARSKTIIPKFVFTDSYSFSVPVMPVSNVVISNVSPSSATSTVSFNITGENFQSGAKTKLSRPGFADIFPATECTFVGPTSLQSCEFDLTGKQTGFWNLVVINPDAQTGILPQGFEIQ
ncbi:MAG: hypothetical protein AB1721_01015 [Patescibacteria group bacterium]